MSSYAHTQRAGDKQIKVFKVLVWIAKFKKNPSGFNDNREREEEGREINNKYAIVLKVLFHLGTLRGDILLAI